MSDDNIMSQALATNRNLVGASCHFFFLVGISVFNIYGIADAVLSHSSGVWKSQTRQKHWAIPPGTSYFSSYTPPSALWPLYLSLEISEVCGCEELWIIKQIKITLNVYSVYKEQTLKETICIHFWKSTQKKEEQSPWQQARLNTCVSTNHKLHKHIRLDRIQFC